MGRKKRKTFELKPFCFYCDREFDDEKVLVQHQKAKHFKCTQCSRKLDTATGLIVHLLQVHKETIQRVPNAMTGRDNPEIVVHGMEGVPNDLIQEKQQKLLEEQGLSQIDKRHRLNAYTQMLMNMAQGHPQFAAFQASFLQPPPSMRPGMPGGPMGGMHPGFSGMMPGPFPHGPMGMGPMGMPGMGMMQGPPGMGMNMNMMGMGMPGPFPFPPHMMPPHMAMNMMQQQQGGMNMMQQQQQQQGQGQQGPGQSQQGAPGPAGPFGMAFVPQKSQPGLAPLAPVLEGNVRRIFSGDDETSPEERKALLPRYKYAS